MRVMIRVQDSNDNVIHYFDGAASDCPPVPRVGEYLDMAEVKGIVKSVIHIHRDLDKPLMRIAITLSDLPAGEKTYSATHNV